MGRGPVILLIHGFPDHWLTWWQQMAELSGSYRVVAMDQRGYNLSDQPENVDDYLPANLVGDVRAVLCQEGADRATIVGHDWGGFVAWHTAMDAPELVERLVVLNMPHPWAMSRELAHNPRQAGASEYARRFQDPSADTQVPRERLSFWVREPAYRVRHDAAMAASSMRGMLNFYRANYPVPPYQERPEAPPSVRVPTLCLHGLDDQYLLANALNNTWQWVNNEVTIVTIPGAGHFVQHDRAERVTALIRGWLHA
jgi:pimeloyl-ACP methyl ester carboxylesterase